MTRPTAEMHPAYCWTCDSCGRDNFVRSTTIALTPDDLLSAGISPEPHIHGAWQSYPDEVTCNHCLAVYPTASPLLLFGGDDDPGFLDDPDDDDSDTDLYDSSDLEPSDDE